MRIKLLKGTRSGRRHAKPGDVVDWPDAVAAPLVESGVAVKVADRPVRRVRRTKREA